MVTVAELARRVAGTIRGNASIVVSEASTMANAAPDHVTLARSDEFAKQLAECLAAVAIVPRGFPDIDGKTLIEVEDVEAAFAEIVRIFRPQRSLSNPLANAGHPPSSCAIAEDAIVDPTVSIGEDVVIGRRCRIHAGVVIGDGSRLGDDVTLFPRVVLYENTQIGHRVIIHSGAVIGAYGFGYQTRNGRHELGPQLGHVEIEDDVEIGACTTIDRGTYDATVIGKGTKIDNHVMIGHNCRIGKYNLICSLAGIAGSCRTGDYVVLAGQSGLSDHITLGDQVRVAAKSGVMQSVPAGETHAGLPAMPEREFWRMWATLMKLPEMRSELRSMQRIVQELQQDRSQQPEPPDQRDAA